MDQRLPLEREKRLLAKLGPKLNSFNSGYGGRSSSKSTLTANDVAAGVSFIRRPGPAGTSIPDTPKQRLVMHIWAGHNSASDVEKVVTGLVQEASKHVRWKPQPGEIRRLAALALLEHVWPTPCRSCSATGYVYEKGAGGPGVSQGVCNACGGTGRRAWGRQRLASLMGVSEWDWRKVWGARYYRMQTMIRWMELRALVQIRRALRSH